MQLCIYSQKKIQMVAHMKQWKRLETTLKESLIKRSQQNRRIKENNSEL